MAWWLSSSHLRIGENDSIIQPPVSCLSEFRSQASVTLWPASQNDTMSTSNGAITLANFIQFGVLRAFDENAPAGRAPMKSRSNLGQCCRFRFQAKRTVERELIDVFARSA
jgi:hypothetical protein